MLPEKWSLLAGVSAWGRAHPSGKGFDNDQIALAQYKAVAAVELHTIGGMGLHVKLRYLVNGSCRLECLSKFDICTISHARVFTSRAQCVLLSPFLDGSHLR